MLTVVVATVAAGWLIAGSQAGRRETIAQRFDTRHTTASRFIQAYIGQVLAQERHLARAVFADQVAPARFDEVAAQNQFTAAVLLDAGGRLLAVAPANPRLMGTVVGARQAHLRSAVAGTAAVSDILSSASKRDPVIEFAVPFDTPSGRRVFSGAYPIAHTPLQPVAVSALATYRTAHVYLLDSAGMVISADRPQQVGQPLDRVAAPLAREVAQHRSGFVGEGDQRQHYVAGPVQGTPWQLVFTLDTAELFRTITPAQRWTPWAALAAFLVMALGMVALFTRALAGRAQAEDGHARQQAILDTAGDAFIGMDATGLVTDWNTAAARLLGWTRNEALGQPVATLMIPPRDRSAHSAALRQFLDNGVARLPGHPITLTAQHRDGHQIPVELTVSRSQWHHTWRFHAFVRDITERLEHERQLRDLALTDSLTGLANHRAFLNRLDQAHARTRRHGTRLDVVYADVDQFKTINDTYGHTAGDAILCQVADRLRAQFRSEDTIGRLGGDEFAVVCEDLTDDCDAMAERVRQALAIPYTFRGQPILATVSIGIATPHASETAEHLLERADTTMYQAKAARRT